MKHKLSRPRRHFLKSSLALPAMLALGPLLQTARAQPSVPVPDGARPILLRGGVVLTMDQSLGDFDQADVLIEDGRISALAPGLTAPEAQVVDATGMIVMPGFVDTHRHMWQGQLRNSIPDGTLADYVQQILINSRPHYRPEDVHIGNLITALSALNAGVTTMLDWSHIGNSPEHSDAAIAALQESGMRAVYGYGAGGGPGVRFPDDIRRLRREYFNSSGQLLTLAMAAGNNAEHWAVAREVGAPITSHVNDRGTLLQLAEHMGPDNTYIHCVLLSDEEFDLIADTGGNVSIATPIEMGMGHGEPPIQQVIDRRIPWSLSTDVETQMAADFFVQMQNTFSLQRMNIFSRERNGESNLPALLSVKEVMEVATIGGAVVNHLDDRTGSLTVGKEADLIMLDMNRINVLPVNSAYGSVVLGMDTSNVDSVFVRGQARKWQGQLVGVDLERVGRMAGESRQYIREQGGWPDSLL